MRITLALIVLLSACAPSAPPADLAPVGDGPYVVMVSFDGMHPDMLARVPTPAFDRIAARGVRAAALIPGYPSKTFPNHYSLATGLYPANHGIVDNGFYDPTLEATYRLGDPEAVGDGRWYGGEPIWVTAEKQGARAASFFWVGTEAEIDGVRPSYWKEYDGSVPYEARVDTVLHWLTLPVEERPRLVMLYFDEPDHLAHRHGPDAPAVDTVVERLDGLLGRLLDGVDALPIADRISLVLVSDHGLAPVPQDHAMVLDADVSLDGVRVVNNSTQALLYFGEDTARISGVQSELNAALEHVTAYRPEELPARWHYTGSPRIGDLVVVTEPGWVLRMREGRQGGGGATHGWDPGFPPMHGIFMAAGPALRAGRTLPAFENVHVYPLVARLLGLVPAPGIDGRLDVFDTVLHAPARETMDR